MKLRILLFLFSMTCAGRIQSQDNPAKPFDAEQYAQRQMDIQVGFEQMVPPGMSIKATEVSRKGSSGKDLIVQYHISVKGVASDSIFQMVQWPVNADNASAGIGGISVGKDGILMCAGRRPDQCGDPNKPDDPIEFTIMPRKGEPSRFAFLTPPDLRIGTVLVGDPIEAQDKGCTLRALRLTSKFELGFIEGSGYPANTDIHYRFTSDPGSVPSNLVIKSDDKGSIRMSVVPYAEKKTRGTATLKVTETKCSPQVSYEWGVI